MKGTKIIVIAEPKGTREECIISGTPLPGTVVELVPSTAPIGGRFTYRLCTRTNGAKGPVVILTEDHLQGKLATDAYVSGTRGFLYWPVAGETFNMLIRHTVGTGSAGEENIGDYLAVEKATGELMAGGSLTSQPFMLLEHLGQESGDQLHWVQYLGNQS